MTQPRRPPRLRTRTTGLLYHLAEAGPGGASACTLARASNLRPRQCAARLRWLQRGALVRYDPATALWHLADDHPPTLLHESCLAGK